MKLITEIVGHTEAEKEADRCHGLTHKLVENYVAGCPWGPSPGFWYATGVSLGALAALVSESWRDNLLSNLTDGFNDGYHATYGMDKE